MCIRDRTYARGLLTTKGPGLCHGVAGNGAALLALWRYTKDAAWLRRARHFAAKLAPNIDAFEAHADQPHSLFQGSAGALAFFLDVLNPDDSHLGAPNFDGSTRPVVDLPSLGQE